MINSEEIKKQCEKKYNSFLKNVITNDESFFPLEIHGNKGKVTDDIIKRSAELKDLVEHCKEKVGVGYTLITENIETKKNGNQTSIKKIIIENEKDFLSFINKTLEVERFNNSLNLIKQNTKSFQLFNDKTFSDWALNHITDLCKKEEDEFWKNILLCVNWFYKNPKSNLYIREIPLQIHTKFIENNFTIIQSFFTFDLQDGLKQKPVLFEIRPLCENTNTDEPKLTFLPKIFSLSSIDLDTLLKNNSMQSIKKIFIIENEMVFLSFPQIRNALCIWGHGYTALMLKDCDALNTKELYYFGDLDEHGFDILSKFRSHFCNTKSFCMDKITLKTFTKFRVASKKSPLVNVPENLNDSEKDVFAILQQDKSFNRLEQERITNEYIQSELLKLNLE